jgi:hypothetical protein
MAHFHAALRLATARALVLAGIVSGSDVLAQSDPVAESRAHYQAAVQAYQARDLARFLEHARQAQALRPTHGGVTYALASAYALTGDSSGAIAMLRRFARLGYWAELTADSDFVRLYDNRDFTDLSRRLERNRTPVVGSAVAFELPGRDLLVEGIAYDPREDRFYLGSVHRARILTVTRSGSVTPLAGGGPIRWAPLGLRVDPKRRALWVATAALPQTAGYSPADSGRSAILRYNLTTGRLTGRHEVQPDGAPHLIGDLIVSRRGDVFATDSRAPVLWRIPAGGDSLSGFWNLPCSCRRRAWR